VVVVGLVTAVAATVGFLTWVMRDWWALQLNKLLRWLF
jgi:hypothetical protein